MLWLWLRLQEKLPAAVPGGQPLPEGLMWLLLTGKVCGRGVRAAYGSGSSPSAQRCTHFACKRKDCISGPKWMEGSLAFPGWWASQLGVCKATECHPFKFCERCNATC